MTIKKIVLILFMLFLTMHNYLIAQPKEIFYIGTFSERGSEGIYVLEFDRNTGDTRIIQTISSKDSPNFLAISPGKKFLFSTNAEGIKQIPQWGSVSSYAIDQTTGKLSHINDQPSYGSDPCHVSVYPNGKWLFISNYGDGVFSILPVTKDGKVGASSQHIQLKGSSTDPSRQNGPHTHSAIPTLDGRHIYVQDLGIDKVLIYNFDNQRGMVSPAKQPFFQVPGGSGPRHFALHKNGELAFLAEELSSTLNVFKVNPNDGRLVTIFRRSTLPSEFKETSYVADVHLNALGNKAYVSNRGHNSIAIFDVNGETNKVKYIKTVPSGGDWPRNFFIDPKGGFAIVANQRSDNLAFFDMNEQGDLIQTDKSVIIPSPVCVINLRLD